MKVFFNSACPVCKAGIKSQQKNLQQCELDWVDVHQDIAARKELPAHLEFVRKRLHVLDDRGNWQVGIDAVIALLEQSPKRRFIARILKLPGIHFMAVVAYNTFAWCLYWSNRLLKRWEISDAQ